MKERHCPLLMIRTQTPLPGFLLYIATEHCAVTHSASHTVLVCDAGTSGNPPCPCVTLIKCRADRCGRGMVTLVWEKRGLGGCGAPGVTHGRVLESCIMCRVHMQGHSVPSDAVLVLWAGGLFSDGPNAPSELFYPVTAIIYTTFFLFEKESRLCKCNAI